MMHLFSYWFCFRGIYLQIQERVSKAHNPEINKQLEKVKIHLFWEHIHLLTKYFIKLVLEVQL